MMDQFSLLKCSPSAQHPLREVVWWRLSPRRCRACCARIIFRKIDIMEVDDILGHNNNKYPALFFALLLSVWAGLGLSNCSRGPAQSEERQTTAKLLDAYIDGYKSGDWGKVRFAADVTFEGPLTNGKILGEAAVQKFLSNVRAKDVRVRRKLIDGQLACVLADFETADGTVVPFCEFFRIKDGQIAEIRPYFDPRPFIR
jgi:Domain of unknown function (DUF4904)